MTSRFSTGLAIGAAIVLLAGIAVWLTVAYAGIYNVAATDRHFDPVRWTFDTTMHRSIANAADEIEAPARVDPGRIAEGGRLYAAACIHCHGAPGVKHEEWAMNMRPMPPELVEAAAEWEPEEIFWIVKNGIKMTGMPAFGADRSDEDVWGIVAFVTQLPAMTPEEFQTATGGGGAHGGSAGTAAQPESEGG